MSDLLLLHDTKRATLQATSLSSSLPPPWLSEAFLVAHLFASSGLLEALHHHVQVPRGRMGRYEVCDFALPLLAYAASTERTLADFFRVLRPWAAPLTALWHRDRLCAPSTLSRFLAAVPSSATEALRALLFEDLLARGLPGERLGGLLDRRATRHVVFDIDGTKQVARQRPLAAGQDRPPPRRRLARLCAKGYTGRKRGEIVRTRTTVQQAHTHEWLGTFGVAGNGDTYGDLARACQLVARYLAARGLTAAQGLVRLDGLYGCARGAARIAQAGLGYLMRGQDYSLLSHPSVRAALAQAHGVRFEQPDTQLVREVYDVGRLDWIAANDPATRVDTRVVVTARAVSEAEQETGPKVGRRVAARIYELFVTDRGAEALTAPDLLSLYFGRGGFERTLFEEDQEHEPDRWCSGHPCGQELWQLLAQWVWNARIRLGAALPEATLRRALWSPAEAPPSSALSHEEAGREASGEPSPPPAPVPPRAPDEPGPPPGPAAPPATRPGVSYRIAAARGRGAGRFGGADFTWTEGGVLRCPAGRELRQGRVRQEEGQERILYQANRHDCQSCALSARCLGHHASGKVGRVVSVVRRQGGEEPEAPGAVPRGAMRAPVPGEPPRPRNEPATGQEAVYWEDLAARQLRRAIREGLRSQRVELVAEEEAPRGEEGAVVETRDQRAHRRLGWEERRRRNARPPTAPTYHVTLYGVPKGVLEYLQGLRELAAAA